MFDRDNTGKIDQNEFHQLWNYLGQWRQIFNQYDADFSGNISQQELGSALQQMGYRLFEGRNFRIKIFIFQIFPSIYSITLSKVWFQSRWKSPVWWFCTFHYNDSGRASFRCKNLIFIKAFDRSLPAIWRSQEWKCPIHVRTVSLLCNR